MGKLYGTPSPHTRPVSYPHPGLGLGLWVSPGRPQGCSLPGGKMEARGLNVHQVLFQHALLVILEAFSSDMLGVTRGLTQLAGLRCRGVWRRSAKQFGVRFEKCSSKSCRYLTSASNGPDGEV